MEHEAQLLYSIVFRKRIRVTQVFVAFSFLTKNPNDKKRPLGELVILTGGEIRHASLSIENTPALTPAASARALAIWWA